MPRRPPKKWMKDCTAGVASRSPGVSNPRAVCGSLWHHKMSRKAKRAALRREEGGRARHVAGVHEKALGVERRIGFFFPDTVFEVRTPSLTHDERARLGQRIVKYGDDPYVSLAGMRLKVAPSPKSYEGGALYVAITEALGHMTWRFDARHNTFTVD